MKWTIFWLVIMLISFVISGLFFANSGMFDENGDFDKERTYEMLNELDNTPLVNFDVEDSDFWGQVENFCDDEECFENRNGGVE